MRRIGSFVSCLLVLAMVDEAWAQDPLYDEKKVADYTLPEALTTETGKEIETVSDWENVRRPEVLRLFKEEVYGNIPAGTLAPQIELLEASGDALDSKAIRKQVALTFRKGEKQLTANLLVYLPQGVENPPLFIGYNFYGNQTIIDDADVVISPSWARNDEEFGITENVGTESSRGMRSHRWAIDKILESGFGLVAIYYGDIDPDRDDFSDGIHTFFYGSGQTKPKPNEWGSIGAWAWGMSRVVDYLQQDPDTQSSKYIAFGHSRLGKTSLWAGALDTRFDIVISNNSGCGGAALFNRKFGETAAAINRNFPHWFSDSFNAYSGKEEDLPVDQHLLIALMAPRPVYIASAEEDRWADPKGEYLSGFHASPVYELYGKQGFPNPDPPEVHQPVMNDIGYHIRAGKHDVTEYDWEQYIAFCKKHLNN